VWTEPVASFEPSNGLEDFEMRRHEIGDADWDRVKGLLPGRGPKADNRLFVNAVLYVARTGIPWRDLPDRFGKWNSAWRRFRRWAEAGVWGRVLAAVRDPDVSTLVLDSTVVRAHPCAAGAQKKLAPRPSAAAAAGSGPRPTRA
jgi:transposase